jgi:hypothetical protein
VVEGFQLCWSFPRANFWVHGFSLLFLFSSHLPLLWSFFLAPQVIKLCCWLEIFLQ